MSFPRYVSALAALSLCFIVSAESAPVAPIGRSGELAVWKGGSTPPLSLTDLSGRTHTLADYRGKVVIINFWATWCEPCRREMPSLQRIARRMEARNVVVLTIDVGEGRERIEQFLAHTGVDLPVLLDRDGGTARAWQARGYPTSYVLATDGRIAYYYVGALDWASPRVTRVIERLSDETRRIDAAR